MRKPLNQLEIILIVISITFFTFALTTCNFNIFVPKKVTIDGTTYRNGFYGNLWPINITFKGDSIKVGNNEFHHINCEKFDWVHSAIGGTTSGILYCAEDQWKEALEYYTDSDNFVYYCQIGAKYVDRDPIITTFPNIDSKKFDALSAFAEKNSYNPFGSNKGIKTHRLTIPDRNKSPKLIFYKESKDGFFTSFKGNLFHIIDGKLLLVFYYTYGHGKYEELVVVDVPDELGQYFIKLLEQRIK